MSNVTELVEYSYAYTPAVFKGDKLVKEGYSDEVKVYETTTVHGRVVKREKKKLRTLNSERG